MRGIREPRIGSAKSVQAKRISSKSGRVEYGTSPVSDLRPKRNASSVSCTTPLAGTRCSSTVTRGQGDGESWAAKLKANAPRVKQSNIPSIANALNSRVIEFVPTAFKLAILQGKSTRLFPPWSASVDRRSIQGV